MHAAFTAIAERGYGPAWKPLSGLRKPPATFLKSNVNYFTFDSANPVQDATYRTAQANFNVWGMAWPRGVILRPRPCLFRLLCGDKRLYAPPFSQNPRNGVICVAQALPAECRSSTPEET
jgi:hypothetical protein